MWYSLSNREKDVKEKIIVFLWEKWEKGAGAVRIPKPKTVYLRLSKSYFEPRTLMSVLRKIFSSVPVDDI